MRSLRWLWLASLLLIPGCPGDDDDFGNDDDVDDDATGDDDVTGDDDTTIPVDPCTETPNPVALSGTICATDAACSTAEIAASVYQSYSMAANGDFDGDGLEDLASGAPGWDVVQDEGRVLLYNAVSFVEPIPAPVAYVEGTVSLENVGYSVSFTPDLDGDGLDDLVIGARGNSTAAEAGGTVYVAHGQALIGDVVSPTAIEPATAIRGTVEYSRAGVSVTGMADVTGDGLGEIALGYDLYMESSGWEFAEDGKVGVFHGIAGGLESELTTEQADVILEGPIGSYLVGYALDGGGDVTGDGMADLLVGAPEAVGSAGRLYIVTGPALQTAGTYAIDDVAVIHEGAESGADLGTAVAHVGDVDGDGLDDMAAGAPESDLTWSDGGSVTLLKGSADIDAGVPPEVLAEFGSEWDDFAFGERIAGGGDVDGDGLDDLLVGAVYAYLGPVMKGGRAYLFTGRESGWDSLLDATQADAGIAGIGVSDNLGRSLALADLDGDSLHDLIIGSPYCDSMSSDSGEIYLFWGTP